jgi:hypothetical protein
MRLGTAFAFVLATVLGLMQGRALIQAALVIDDVGDQNAHLLPNPMNDARDIAELIAADQEATTPLSAVEERVLKPKDNFKECAQCPEIVVVSSGSFTVGSPDSEEGRIEEEGPLHCPLLKRPRRRAPEPCDEVSPPHPHLPKQLYR